MLSMMKFDIANLIAKEHVPFFKYPAIHELDRGMSWG
jgi:hypothetical protein